MASVFPRVIRIGHVVLSVADIAASRHFYVDLLGLNIVHEDDRALYLRGVAWQEGRRLDLARADLEAAVAAGPNALDYPKARQALAICLLDLGDFPPAADLFRAALVDDPDDVYALFGSGRASSK